MKNFHLISAIALIVVISTPLSALARSFWFRGTIINSGQRVVGVWENNHAAACLSLAGEVLLTGHFAVGEDGIPENFERVEFLSQAAAREGKFTEDKRVLTVKFKEQSSKLQITEKEAKEIEKCEELSQWQNGEN
jgi:hypothetical protein